MVLGLLRIGGGDAEDAGATPGLAGPGADGRVLGERGLVAKGVGSGGWTVPAAMSLNAGAEALLLQMPITPPDDGRWTTTTRS